MILKLAGLAGGVFGWLRAIPGWLWALMAGGSAVLVLLMWFRTELHAAERRGDKAGYARAVAEAAEAADAAGQAMVKQMQEAEQAAADRARARQARLRPIHDKARDYARTASDCPDPAGRLLVNEAVRAANDSAATRPRG